MQLLAEAAPIGVEQHRDVRRPLRARACKEIDQFCCVDLRHAVLSSATRTWRSCAFVLVRRASKKYPALTSRAPSGGTVSGTSRLHPQRASGPSRSVCGARTRVPCGAWRTMHYCGRIEGTSARDAQNALLAARTYMLRLAAHWRLKSGVRLPKPPRQAASKSSAPRISGMHWAHSTPVSASGDASKAMRRPQC